MTIYEVLAQGKEVPIPIDQYIMAAVAGMTNPEAWAKGCKEKLLVAMARDTNTARALFTPSQVEQFYHLVNVAYDNYGLMTARPSEQTTLFEQVRQGRFV